MAARLAPAVDLGTGFVAPIIASLLAVPVLRERLDGRKLVALALGFAGALLVVRPGASMEAALSCSRRSPCSSGQRPTGRRSRSSA